MNQIPKIEAPKPKTLPLKTAVIRGMKKRCPKCGEGHLFEGWNKLHKKCSHCGCELLSREGDCWAFMYVTMGAFIGIFLIWMIFFPAPNLYVGFTLLFILVPGSLLLTLPRRKGIALAIEIWLSQ